MHGCGPLGQAVGKSVAAMRKALAKWEKQAQVEEYGIMGVRMLTFG